MTGKGYWKPVHLLLLSNLLLAALLVAISLHEQYPQRILKKLGFRPTTMDYRANPQYPVQVDRYAYYRKEGAVVMLGNSLTQGIDWNELLDRCDILNRGIGQDITEGYLNRLETVIAATPRLCFILGGINDLVQGMEPEQIVRHIDQISAALRQNDIQPVLQSVIHVSKAYPRAAELNTRIADTNDRLRALAQKKGLPFIDLNQVLAPDGHLKAAYTTDGVHLTGSGYAQWGALIEPVIESVLK